MVVVVEGWGKSCEKISNEFHSLPVVPGVFWMTCYVLAKNKIKGQPWLRWIKFCGYSLTQFLQTKGSLIDELTSWVSAFLICEMGLVTAPRLRAHVKHQAGWQAQRGCLVQGSHTHTHTLTQCHVYGVVYVTFRELAVKPGTTVFTYR